MSTRRRKSALALNTRAFELALAAPQVVAHRMQRMAAAGPMPGPRDQREFSLMFTEKASAFAESWMAMMMQAWWSWWTVMSPWGSDFGVSMMKAGLAPVHRRATANARRLKASNRRRG